MEVLGASLRKSELNLRSRHHIGFAAITNSSVPAAQAQVQYVMPPLCDPGVFTGTGKVDVDEWLSTYQHVAKSYRWDLTLMMGNVIFYLGDTAKACFETHEAELASLDICKEKLQDLFGKPIGRQAEAQKNLASRAQTSNESCIFYI